MSINKVQLVSTTPHNFRCEHSEYTIYQSPARTSFSISTPGNTSSISSTKGALESTAGMAFVTNQRIIYIPTNPTPAFDSFSCPITNIYDSRVTTPWFGPNVWTALIKPVRSSGLPEHTVLEVKLTFKDGGAFDFHGFVERLKERILQMMESRGETRAPLDAHLEELPTYEDAGNSRRVVVEEVQPPPGYEPPGYEEVQAESVRDAVEALERSSLEDGGRR
ncbi:hypothetical protein EX30DRAFT_337534 [Ascodesmis nigricans]|uniref:Uncharacterized protein n=1 Tax=Ascodesmis nigricans TaxID=341454 RepID=A0A4S2N716_9PEZI|nr:hypothetical protein EX30DRAFT_337534 [Ascodesmis nigricans]